MNAFSVLVWNMALGSYPKRDPRPGWSKLKELTEGRAHIALLNEAADVPSSLHAVFESQGTKGRDRKRRPWSTAIVSNIPMTPISDAKPRNYLGQSRTHYWFENSRPGSWTAVSVQLSESVEITCISLYGLLDDLSDASVHRSLSDLDPIFSDPRYANRVILGGDLNLTTQWHGEPRARAMGVFDRIRSFGLEDCLLAKRDAGRIDGCTCSPDPCTHTRTKWEPGSTDGGYPHQMDYLFATPNLIENGGLVRCEVPPAEVWNSVSDHAPLEATFEVR